MLIRSTQSIQEMTEDFLNQPLINIRMVGPLLDRVWQARRDDR